MLKYEFHTRLLRAEKNEDGALSFLEAVNEPVIQNEERWNIPYYCYLVTRTDICFFLVTFKEVGDALKLDQEAAWKEIRPVLLELYEEQTPGKLEEGSLPDARFYDTYLYLKSIRDLANHPRSIVL